jgi:hypothetical protein
VYLFEGFVDLEELKGLLRELALNVLCSKDAAQVHTRLL